MASSNLLLTCPYKEINHCRIVLAGNPGPARDIVVLNAAAALFTANVSDDQRVCATRAAEAIDSGAARDLLARLVQMC